MKEPGFIDSPEYNLWKGILKTYPEDALKLKSDLERGTKTTIRLVKKYGNNGPCCIVEDQVDFLKLLLFKRRQLLCNLSSPWTLYICDLIDINQTVMKENITKILSIEKMLNELRSIGVEVDGG